VKREACPAPLVETEMLRVLLYVTLLTALFVGAVFFTGNAIGAWEPATVPLHAPDASSTERSKPKKHKKNEPSAKRNK
jgi:hypothetical protein